MLLYVVVKHLSVIIKCATERVKIFFYNFTEELHRKLHRISQDTNDKNVLAELKKHQVGFWMFA